MMELAIGEMDGRGVNFSSDAIADFEGLLEGCQEICKKQMVREAVRINLHRRFIRRMVMTAGQKGAA